MEVVEVKRENATEDVTDTVKEYVSSLSITDSRYQLTPLQHQTSNLHFRLETEKANPGTEYFVKHFQRTHFIPVNRQANFTLQRQVADAGYAPMPVSLSEDHQIQVEHWVEQEPMNQCSRQQKVCKAAEVLAHIHQLPICVTEMNLLANWQRYLDFIPAHYHDDLCQRMDACTSIWETSNALCLCHHDMSFGHIAGLGSNVIFDWEYAALGDPHFDLACCILINQLTQPEIQCLLEVYCAYFPSAVESFVTENVTKMLPVALLTNDLWQLAYDNNQAVDSNRG
ncbi:phosphotransferase [Paraneptunicella aestuarii]|uniref:phosphotransferase n=1 Tax=Paraneptunicella aestuarii TaxID=2831148 RepID=UPI001E609D8D|nr:phosphotransferase [Paraneptunicella aestuarii]UAA39969.1 phosphotransferase [Paraneptunicella aestuarii]